jgi:UDP-2,3-diacylglucosamine pyrophosphatase LpxH
MTFRSIWISDVHLGSKHAQVDALIDFLRRHDSQHLYVVGDFVDGWELKRRWFWKNDYNVLLQKILRKSRKDTRVTFLYGNHDEFLEDYAGLRFGAVRLMERCIHTGADGRRYLVLHGHQFDGLVGFNRLLERVGSRIYDWILGFNTHFNRVRRRLGFGYWSVAAYLKFRAKSAVKYVTQFEEAVVRFARSQKVDGVICGHIHRAEIRDIEGVLYLNCGDWVESCSALVEEWDGTLRILTWAAPGSKPAGSDIVGKESNTKANQDEGSVHRAGGGPGAHDPGDGGGGNDPEARPRDRGRRGRDESQPELAGLFRDGL